MHINLYISSYPGGERPLRQGAFTPLGASQTVVVVDTPESFRADFALRADRQDQRAAIDALLESNVPMLLKGRESEYHVDRWIVFTAHSRTRMADKSWIATTTETLPWVEVERPDGALSEWPPEVISDDLLPYILI